MHVSILILIMLSGMPENRRTPQNTAGRDGVLCGMRIAECRNLKRCILRNFTCGTFHKLHHNFCDVVCFSIEGWW